MSKLVLIAGGSTLVYAVLAVMIGVLPAIELSKTPPSAGVDPLTPLQAQGRDVYVANGCSYCHTQQVRPLPQDKVFGRPSAPGDFAHQTPALLGSGRTGPDLTNIGERKPSTAWQFIHLYNPRAVVPESIMPAFDWMFQVVDQAPLGVTPVALPKAYAPAHGVVVPTRNAEALVAYLLSLRQVTLPDSAAEGIAGTEASSPAATAAGGVPPAGGGYDAAKGRALFVAHCAACHQANGEGVPGAFPPLKASAVVNDAEATRHIRVVLHGAQGSNIGGVVYSSPMPPFGNTLSDADIANIISYERSSWGNHGALVTAEQVATARAKGK